MADREQGADGKATSLEHHEDGSVSIEGEKVTTPRSYKGERLADAPEND